MITRLLVYATLLINVSLASRTLVPAVIRDLHHKTIRRTHNLASDLRLAFRGILLPRAETNEHLVYCKSGKQAPFSSGGNTGGTDGNASSTGGADQTTVIGTTGSSGRGSSTSRGPSSSSTRAGSNPSPTVSPSSLWKLTNSYVCRSSVQRFDPFWQCYSKEATSSMAGTSLLVEIQQMVSISVTEPEWVLHSHFRDCGLYRPEYCGTYKFSVYLVNILSDFILIDSARADFWK